MWNLFKKSERRMDERAPAPDLDVRYSTESVEKQARVRDISSSGLYLITQDPLVPGESVDLTVKRFAHSEEDRRPEVQLRAKTVRVGEDGVAVTLANESVDAAAWSRLTAAAVRVSGDMDRVRLLRTTKALAFLLGICPSAEEDVLRLVSNRLSSERAERAVEIALNADELLAARNQSARTDLPKELVVRILEDGPKADEEQTRRFWAELLATSCVQGTQHEENLSYANLLSKLDTVQVRVLTTACDRAMRIGWGPGLAFHEDLHCSADEIRKISHIQNLMAIERDLNHLYDLGLLELTERPILCAPVERVNMTPTFLALQLYARCRGELDPPETLASTELQRAC